MQSWIIFVSSDREQANDRYTECDPELPALQEAEDGNHCRPPAKLCKMLFLIFMWCPWFSQLITCDVRCHFSVVNVCSCVSAVEPARFYITNTVLWRCTLNQGHNIVLLTFFVKQRSVMDRLQTYTREIKEAEKKIEKLTWVCGVFL